VHDLRVLREQIDLLRDGMRRRGVLDALAPVIDRGQGVERERRTLIQAVEERKAQRNTIAQDVAKRKRAKEDADELIAQGRSLGDEIAQLERELAAVEVELNRSLLEIPNITLPDVPAGGEEQNVIVREWGTPRPSPGVKPHWEIGAKLGMIDLERASKVSGPALSSIAALGLARPRAAQLLHGHASRGAWLRGSVAAAARESRDDDRHGPASEVRGRRIRDADG
jgi:Seryl-tRNA synthetase